jgi:type I restriction-modification system DNA methylase subunit/restriction endonuclease S subunit
MSNFENIINAIRNILRNEGITGMESINHCVAFAILRYMTTEKCIHFNIPEKYAFDNFLIDAETNESYPNNDCRILTKFYSKDAYDDDFLSQLREKFNFTQLAFKINSPFNFVSIIKKITELDFNEIHDEYDIVGMIYEIHLKTGTSNSMRDLGQYFTHRKVIKFMIELCDPKLKSDGQIETILDPSMGSGGFISMSIKYLNKKYPRINWLINKTNIYGFDIDENVRNLSLLNSLLESGEVFNGNLIKNDTLKNDYKLDNNTIIQNVDIILANEPFGLKGLKYKDCCKRIKNLKIEGTKSEPLFLQLMLQSLNINGRCAVIIPDGVLFTESKLHHETRKYLIEHLNLRKVVSLSEKMFLNTGVKSSILFFVNDGRTVSTEFSKIKNSNDNIIEESIITVDYKNLVNNNYYLKYNKYTTKTEDKLGNIEYKKLGDICDFLAKSKRLASYGKSVGLYPFYTSSNILDKYCDEPDYTDECVIFGTGGNANIKISNNFSCSADNFIIKSEYNKYIYYWFLSNIKILDDLFHGSTIKHLSKNDLENIQIPILPIEIQTQIVNILDTYYDKIELNKRSIESYNALKKSIIQTNTLYCKKNRLGELCNFLEKSKRLASYGKPINPCHVNELLDLQLSHQDRNLTVKRQYPFFTSSNVLDKYCDEPDYTDECIIFGTGGNANIKISNNFSCSADNFIIRSEYNKYIYYWFQSNIKILNDLFHGSTIKHLSKNDLENIEIPIPSIDIQNMIIQQCEYYDNQITVLEKENINLATNNVIDTILNSLTKNGDSSNVQTNETINETTNETINETTNETINDPIDEPNIEKIITIKKVKTNRVIKKTISNLQTKRKSFTT